MFGPFDEAVVLGSVDSACNVKVVLVPVSGEVRPGAGNSQPRAKAGSRRRPHGRFQNCVMGNCLGVGSNGSTGRLADRLDTSASGARGSLALGFIAERLVEIALDVSWGSNNVAGYAGE